MKWKISWLKNQPNQTHEVDEDITFDKTMFRNITSITWVDKVNVNGSIKYKDNLVNINLILSGSMYLPCALSGEDGEYKFNFVINEILDDSYNHVVDYNGDSVDLYELVWQRLIIEAPTKFVKNNNLIKSGKSWRLISEDEYDIESSEKIDPRFEKLKDLFKDEKEE